jgi:hypothetical protein
LLVGGGYCRLRATLDDHGLRQGIVLSVTGNVAGQRQISGAKSDLLFDILTRLRPAGDAR